MLKKIILFFFLLSLNIILVNSANISINSEIYNDYTTYQYNFLFNKNEDYNSFSIEKPIGSKLNFAHNEKGKEVSSDSAGNFFIFKTKNPNSKNITVKFTVYSISKKKQDLTLFSTYLNFNFPVEILKFNLKINKDFEKIKNIFPRNYERISNNKFKWIINNPKKDTLFLINFIPKNPNETSFKISKFYIIIIIGIIILLALFLTIKIYLKKNKNEIKKEIKKEIFKINKKNLFKNKSKNIDEKYVEKNNNNLNNKQNNNPNSKNQKIEEKKIELNFEKIIKKYLTENEIEIVSLIKKNEGIIQNDILNFIPTISKSNLSKIISKLNSLKFLKKLKVGKVNKIYLGEKLKFSENNNDKNGDRGN